MMHRLNPLELNFLHFGARWERVRLYEIPQHPGIAFLSSQAALQRRTGRVQGVLNAQTSAIELEWAH
jgi:hypothetical protein